MGDFDFFDKFPDEDADWMHENFFKHLNETQRNRFLEGKMVGEQIEVVIKEHARRVPPEEKIEWYKYIPPKTQFEEW